MRFKQRKTAQLPEVDLIPMLNVMMGILAFFVMITMTLSNEQLLEVQLPNKQAVAVEPSLAEPFIVEIDAQGKLLLNNQLIEKDQLEAQMEFYLPQSPENTVFILPNRQLAYEQVIQFLAEMRKIGGDRVSLAISE
ncbi:MAG: biopolymer transporter ExbD [Leptolyngbyaceae cyanobacterium MO_188.B28]|nr:biopolymer transporter ExbD [Leptolyngbyaceae cyanobacterium MO_188.B28]